MVKRYSTPASFTPSTGVIDASNIPNFNPAKVLAIIDTTARAFLYDVVTPGLGYFSVSGLVMTVELLSAQDNILIVWDDGMAVAEPGGAAITGAAMPTGGLGLTGWLSAIWKTLTGTISTTASNPSAIYASQFTPGLTAGALPSQALVNGVILKALLINTGTIYVGQSGVTTSTGFPLTAEDAIPFACTNLSQIYAIGGNATDALAWAGN